MKNTKKIVTKFAKKAAENALKLDARSTSCGVFYQPKAPAKLAKFKAEK